MKVSEIKIIGTAEEIQQLGVGSVIEIDYGVTLTVNDAPFAEAEVIFIRESCGRRSRQCGGLRIAMKK